MSIDDEKICPVCGRPYRYVEKKKFGRKIYVFAIHIEEGGRKKRCLLEKKLDPDTAERELRELLNVAKNDPLLRERFIPILREFLEATT